MEKETLLETYQVEMFCDACKEGLMISAGSVITTFPEKYPHVCGKCGIEAQYDLRYPTVRYKIAKPS